MHDCSAFKLKFRSILYKIGPAVSFVLMLSAVFLLGSFMHSKNGPFLYVVSGHLFTGSFDRIHAGTYLDQPTIGKWYFLFILFTAMTLPATAVAKWLNHRKTHLAYWFFVVPAVALCMYLLITLTVPFWWLVQYIHSMGVTPKRIYGLMYCLGGYILILTFLYWVIKFPSKNKGNPIDHVDQ